MLPWPKDPLSILPPDYYDPPEDELDQEPDEPDDEPDWRDLPLNHGRTFRLWI